MHLKRIRQGKARQTGPTGQDWPFTLPDNFCPANAQGVYMPERAVPALRQHEFSCMALTAMPQGAQESYSSDMAASSSPTWPLASG